MAQSQKERLKELLADGMPHSNFDLAFDLYGLSPCGRLGARIHDLKRDGLSIDGWPDKKIHAKYWYQWKREPAQASLF